MCTAYLLRNYETLPNEKLTVYFDDVASTFPIENLPLEHYILKPTPPNTTLLAKISTPPTEIPPTSPSTSTQLPSIQSYGEEHVSILGL